MICQSIKSISWILLFPLLLLGACSSMPKSEWNISHQEHEVQQTKAQASGEGVIITQSAQPARLIRSSKSAPWLEETIVANYRELDAKTAILAILDHRPVRFEIESNGPNVKALPGAATIREHLQAISVQANWAFRVDKGVIAFSDWQVINYPLDFILGDKQANLSVTGTIVGNNDAINSTEQGGAVNQNNQNNLAIAKNSLDELNEVMQQIIDSTSYAQTVEDSREISYSVVQATNSVLLSAPPHIQKKVQSALDAINKIAGRNIYLDFDIFTVHLTKEYQRALDVDVLRQSGIGVESRTRSGLLSDSHEPFMLQLDFPKSNYIDSAQLMLKALAQHGEASLTNQGTLLLKNNEVGNIQTSTLNRFVEIVNSEDAQSTAPAYRESIIQVLPSIVGEEINLHLILSNADVQPYVKSIKRELEPTALNATGAQQGQFRYRTSLEVENAKFGEQFVIPTQIRNGQTLLIAGLTSRDYQDQTLRNQLLPVVGDNKNRRQGRREVIVVITAYLVD